jgi:cation transport regulator ChaC
MKSVYKIFAYGSLINQASLKKTVPEARNTVPVKTYGLQRVFNLASHYRFDTERQSPVCVLNIDEADTECVMNGICFEMDEVSLDKLLEREKGYEFCRIKARHYYDEDQVFEAHYFRARQFTPYKYLSGSSAQQHYMNLCLDGSREHGENFVTDFKKSTSFWGIERDEEMNAIWQGNY